MYLYTFPCSARSPNQSDEDNVETGSDIDLFLLSQDIDSAIERFLPSGSSQPSIPNNAQLPKEEFLPAKLNSWELTTYHTNEGNDRVE